MAEPNKQQVGDGSDNYGQAASQAAKAAKAASKAGKEIAQQAVQKGAEATANAAAASFRRRGHYATHCLRFSSAFALQ